MISVIKPSQAGPIHFLVSESFDLGDARAIHRALAASGTDAIATIDFRPARHCDPVAVAQLARDIAARPGRIAISGMGHHDHRLLGYLGRSREARSPRRAPPPRLRSERLAAGVGADLASETGGWS